MSDPTDKREPTEAEVPTREQEREARVIRTIVAASQNGMQATDAVLGPIFDRDRYRQERDTLAAENARLRDLLTRMELRLADIDNIASFCQDEGCEKPLCLMMRECDAISRPGPEGES